MSLESWVETRLPQLQAKVGLLQLLNDTPSLPSENAPNVASISGSAHVLPFLKEKELVQTLAFIASSTDDPAKVIAVCVEEGIDQKSMTVKLAVNTGDLDNVVVAFKRIAIVLQRNCKGGDGEIDDVEVTREVIRLNRNRILCRLRSRHARTKSQHARLGRPKPLLSLAHVLANVKKSTSQDVLVPQFEEVIGELCECFVQLENLSESEGRSETGLVLSFAIIMAARKLHCSRSIAKLLKLSDYDDTQKVHIRHTVSKLGRYSTASEFLVQAARKYTVFAKITVQFITVSALPLPPIKHPEIFAETLRTGLLSAKELRKTSSKVRDRLEIKSLASACSRTSSSKFKVHAEIQLFFHYETYIAPLRPRVLCSSKHACLLCELFIRSHGKFFLPSSHGRLYAQWTSPASLPGLLGEAAETMIIVLEIFAASIQESLRSQILFTKKRFAAPNESVMLGSVIWSDPAEALPDSIPNDSGYDKTDIQSDETTSTSTLQ
ncbi:uncharacterized protein RAG0_05001 [Rhynchosporium agropyri]|uniref:Uncharacterized protein n=1 Tax=Rhynchosporium agropyri TaxID=914238 RepID=A0A1E1KB30_9HELO|nr:uncharacterized protein RAG0_05001 [Rhynchosporium agropyri]